MKHIEPVARLLGRATQEVSLNLGWDPLAVDLAGQDLAELRRDDGCPAEPHAHDARQFDPDVVLRFKVSL